MEHKIKRNLRFLLMMVIGLGGYGCQKVTKPAEGAKQPAINSLTDLKRVAAKLLDIQQNNINLYKTFDLIGSPRSAVLYSSSGAIHHNEPIGYNDFEYYNTLFKKDTRGKYVIHTSKWQDSTFVRIGKPYLINFSFRSLPNTLWNINDSLSKVLSRYVKIDKTTYFEKINQDEGREKPFLNKENIKHEWASLLPSEILIKDYLYANLDADSTKEVAVSY